jgi:hypothetical protein
MIAVQSKSMRRPPMSFDFRAPSPIEIDRRFVRPKADGSTDESRERDPNVTTERASQR